MSSVRVTSGAREIVIEDDRARGLTLLAAAAKAIKDVPEPPAEAVAVHAAGFETELAAQTCDCTPADQAKCPQKAASEPVGFRVSTTSPPRR